MSNKLRNIQGGWYAFYCPGCKSMHAIPAKPPNDNGWDFNGNMESPTFSPSILVNDDLGNPGRPRCHLFLRDGQLQCYSDSGYEFTGKTIPLEESTSIYFMSDD